MDLADHNRSFSTKISRNNIRKYVSCTWGGMSIILHYQMMEDGIQNQSQKLVLYCLKYFMARGGEVVAVVTETFTNSMTPVLSKSDHACAQKIF